jgi:hypothetical protein
MDLFHSKEFSKHYAHSWIPVRLPDGVFVAFVNSIDLAEDGEGTNYARMKLFKNTHDDKANILGRIKGFDVRIPLRDVQVLPIPYIKVFDDGGTTHIYRRSPQRQWTRGISRNNSVFNTPLQAVLGNLHHDEVHMMRGLHTSAEHNIFNLFTNNVAGSLDQAIEDIDKYTLLSRAINDKYFISLKPDNDNEYILYRLSQAVAFYKKNENVFTLVNDVYRQELEDFCKRNRIYSDIRKA